MKKPCTLIDIAKACNTSNVTVSKALSGKSGVSNELREKIKTIAEEMGYISNRSSAVKNNRIVGVLIPEKFINPNGSFYWGLYNCIVQRLKKEGISCIMENLSQEDENKFIMPNFVIDHKISGLISLGQVSDSYAERLYLNLPQMLMLDYCVPQVKADSIISNGYAGGYKLCSYLISMGHTKIGYIGTKLATTSIFDRYMGYLKAMIEHGLDIPECWTIDDRGTDGKFIDISLPDQMPTAFICNCDETAYLAIKQLKEKGYSVPEDISVVGYDNYLISEVSDPTITTIAVDAEYMADSAVCTIVERIANPNKQPRTQTLDGDLVIKNSVNKLV